MSAPKARFMAQEFSAGAVIYRGPVEYPEYLLLKYLKSYTPPLEPYWGLSKGHLESGESPEQAARREAFEETGLNDLSFMPDFKEVIEYRFTRPENHTEKNRASGEIVKQVTFFLARAPQAEAVKSDEHLALTWHNYKDALALIRFELDKQVLEKAHEFLTRRQPETARR